MPVSVRAKRSTRSHAESLKGLIGCRVTNYFEIVPQTDRRRFVNLYQNTDRLNS